jgi:hypothetical protein
MWKKEAWSVDGVGEGAEGELSEEDGGERLKALSDKALEHFGTLKELEPAPSYSMDSFISVHSKVS